MSDIKVFDPTTPVAICTRCGCIVSELVAHACVADQPATTVTGLALGLDWNEQAAAWVLALDPDEMETKVLEVTDWGISPMVGVKTVLVAWLRGEDPTPA